MIRVSAAEFVDFLSELSMEDFNGDAVESYFDSHRFDEHAFDNFTFFCDAHYARNLVARNENFELLVLSWLQGQGTPIHDHGGQKCWMWVQSGELSYENYHPFENGRVEPMGPTASMKKGPMCYIDDSIGLHSLGNIAAKPAVTIHLYSKPVNFCKVYDPTAHTMKQVELEYFSENGKNPIVDAPISL